MEKISVANIEINLIKKNIKNLHLAVYPPKGKVRVSAPNTTDLETIRLFIISKLPWIKNKQTEFKNQKRQSERDFVSGESHYFRGHRYLLNVIYDKTNLVQIRNKKYIDLYVAKNSSQKKREQVMKEWYRKDLKSRIPVIISKWEKIININIMKWGVRLMKTKWGSCNQDSSSILINLELAKKNDRCLEYVIVHEMVHLLEEHHNERFHSYMNEYLTNWQSIREELNALSFESSQWTY